jgi:phage major head subunit gpT-like protein
LIKEVIGNKTFVHMEYEKISGYLLINKRFEKIEIKEAKIKEVLNGIYTFVEELQ